MIKALYPIFLAIFIALFVGLGIAAFYPAPKQPEFMNSFYGPKGMNETVTEAEKAEITQNEQQFKEYQNQEKTYSRNVSIIAIVVSLLLLVFSLTLLARIDLISDGSLLGGILVLLYGIVRGFVSESDKFRFLIVSIGLIVALVVGYFKFMRRKEA